MKTSIFKRLMMCALTVSLVAAPVIGVSAKTGTLTPGKSAVVGAVNGHASDSAAEVITIAEAVAAIPTTSSVGDVQSTVSGAYCATSVNGIAVTTKLDSLIQGYGLASNEKPHVVIWDLDPKKSFRAKQVIDLAASSQGAVVGPMLNIELGKMTSGKYSLLSPDGPAIRLAVGVPASFAQEGKTFAVIRVQVGGVFTIFPDIDNNPNTVTFDTTGGAGAYAIIKY